MLKAIIDTNIWISGLMKSPLTMPLIDAFIENKFQSFVSNPLLKEIESTLAKPRIARRINKDIAREMLEMIAAKSKKHDPITTRLSFK